MVKNIHMKQRMIAGAFSIKTRGAKDRYVNSQFKNVLNELLDDAANPGVELVTRKLAISQVSLQISQSLGIDYPRRDGGAYYYLRRHRAESDFQLLRIVKSIIERGSEK
jgi:hypothetical protein